MRRNWRADHRHEARPPPGDRRASQVRTWSNVALVFAVELALALIFILGTGLSASVSLRTTKQNEANRKQILLCRVGLFNVGLACGWLAAWNGVVPSSISIRGIHTYIHRLYPGWNIVLFNPSFLIFLAGTRKSCSIFRRSGRSTKRWTSSKRRFRVGRYHASRRWWSSVSRFYICRYVEHDLYFKYVICAGPTRATRARWWRNTALTRSTRVDHKYSMSLWGVVCLICITIGQLQPKKDVLDQADYGSYPI